MVQRVTEEDVLHATHLPTFAGQLSDEDADDSCSPSPPSRASRACPCCSSALPIIASVWRLVYACLFEAGAAAESASTVVVETVPAACELGSELGAFVDASTHNGD